MLKFWSWGYERELRVNGLVSSWVECLKRERGSDGFRAVYSFGYKHAYKALKSRALDYNRIGLGCVCVLVCFLYLF